tara:strand:+ start:2458 stop:3210 length:753 start_codon:yes stop_codon:yes gene_type:complete
MTYFLGRDVDLYITTESATMNSSATVSSIVVDTVSGAKLLASASATSGSMIPQMAFAAAISGAINDVTGVDLSISVSDEDVGPFLGKPQIMQKVELRKETTVTITRKKYDNFWDVIFNGPAEGGSFVGDATNAKRMGARFGAQYTGATAVKIGDGNEFMHDVDDIAGSTNCCYGYRLHIVLKAFNSAGNEEVFVIKNAVMTGHTVTLNADGVSEETIEFSSSIAPKAFVPTAAVGSDGWSDFTPTVLTEL